MADTEYMRPAACIMKNPVQVHLEEAQASLAKAAELLVKSGNDGATVQRVLTEAISSHLEACLR